MVEGIVTFLETCGPVRAFARKCVTSQKVQVHLALNFFYVMLILVTVATARIDIYTFTTDINRACAFDNCFYENILDRIKYSIIYLSKTNQI